MKIAIIGGGIGGLSAALALRRAGFEPEVFEQAPALLDVGAAIAVWPNAMRILQTLGVGAPVLERAGLIKEARWLNRDGKLLSHFKLPDTDAPAVALHRADLQNALLHALPAQLVHLGKTFLSYQTEPDGIRADFMDGTSITCQVLIGADGIHSKTRAQALKDGAPVYRGYTVWRGINHSTPASLLPSAAIEVYGRGQRFGIGPVGLGRTGWWATANEPETAEDSPDIRQQKLLDLFEGWYAPIIELIKTTPPMSIRRSSTYDRPPVSKWGEGSLTLLGDAAHPMTPNLGQGGCMAIEDAMVLASCLLKYQNPPEALRVYEKLRSARANAVARYSLRYGMVGQWESRTATWMRGKLLSLVPESLGRKLLRLLFDYDAGAATPE
jgi:2-polyprenyl-6-methoxyphenol hydroxylase-like FAD-dependent oxidoreductase